MLANSKSHSSKVAKSCKTGFSSEGGKKERAEPPCMLRGLGWPQGPLQKRSELWEKPFRIWSWGLRRLEVFSSENGRAKRGDEGRQK